MSDLSVMIDICKVNDWDESPTGECCSREAIKVVKWHGIKVPVCLYHLKFFRREKREKGEDD